MPPLKGGLLVMNPTFSVIYRPVVNNVVADAISRQYDNEEDDNTEHFQQWAKDICKGFPVESTTSETLHATLTIISDTLDTVTTTNYNWKQLHAPDDTITSVKVLIKDKDAITTDATPEVKNLMKHKKKVFHFKDLLYYQEEKNSEERLVGPDSQQSDIMKLYHYLVTSVSPVC